MPKNILILNGPNLNMLGKREPGIYGSKTLADIENDCRVEAERLGYGLDFRQSNLEGDLVTWIQQAPDLAEGLIINPAGYGHTSIAMHDALRLLSMPIVEVHLSNIHAREEFRHKTMVAPVATGMICGFGPIGYTLAIQALAARL
jgi:3-dehydroquinate dehydratase II